MKMMKKYLYNINGRLDFFEDSLAENCIYNYYKTGDLSYIVNSLEIYEVYKTSEIRTMELERLILNYGDNEEIYNVEERLLLSVNTECIVISCSDENPYDIMMVLLKINDDNIDYISLLGLHKLIEKAFKCTIFTLFSYANKVMCSYNIKIDYETILTTHEMNLLSFNIFYSEIISLMYSTTEEDFKYDLYEYLLDTQYEDETYNIFNAIDFREATSLNQIIERIDHTLNYLSDVKKTTVQINMKLQKQIEIQKQLNYIERNNYIDDFDIYNQYDIESDAMFSTTSGVKNSDEIINLEKYDFESAEGLLRTLD